MKNLVFKTYHEAEDYLNEQYSNKVVSIQYYTARQQKTFIGKVDRIAIDVALHDPPIIIIIFNNGKKFEFEKDEFFIKVQILK